MPRRKLTEAEKKKMKEGRRLAMEERKAAMQIINGSLLQNPRFWQHVDDTVVAGIKKAMEKAENARKARRIKELEAELARLKGD